MPIDSQAGSVFNYSTEKGAIPLSTYLTLYRVGDIVDIKANGAVQKGLGISGCEGLYGS